jgi:uncharacterized protein (TIRG00374 family)
MGRHQNLVKVTSMERSAKTRRPSAILIVLAAGLSAFVLYLAFFVDLGQVAQTLSQTNLSIYWLAFASYIMFTVCSSLTWHNLLGTLEVQISNRKAFLYTWVGLFFDATVPQLGWSAEVSKTYLLSKDQNTQTGRVGASVVGQKLFTMTLSIGALAAGLSLLLVRYAFPLLEALLIGLVLALSILTLSIVYYVSFKPSATKKLLGWAVRTSRVFRKNWNPEGFVTKAEELLGSFHESISQLKKKPQQLIKPAAFTVAGFIFEVSVMFIAFASLGKPVPIDIVLIVFTLTGTLQTVGVAFFGFPELIMTITLTALNIDAALAVSVALLTRVVNLWFRLVISYVALQWAGVKIMHKNKPVP